ncbi:MAG: D-Ala-D-Ala carboxypeptidase family metallohydrolase [Parvibaculum sp.]|uniref:D-Ala-D-Ala carboxypeptidase family metallohydrolase n=1 Tax=Parvibaculum sp. TaxID=2024848 RepID=UPI002726DBC3|nr:D-Ala-D-Ala carboxypeptidase family metallohydrolase [Parvibaculum sp.]MDO8840345.1 D-Ala-D-Ala carboxypeptidase family metallohydrolase [Parvibaculum sp.]
MIDWRRYPNFSEREFRCSATGQCDMQAEFLDVLQAIRTEYGRPMRISSGFRARSHPVERRKAATGAHPQGIAADILVSGAAALALMDIARKHGIRRIGLNQKGAVSGRFLHLDIGGPGLSSPAVWTY